MFTDTLQKHKYGQVSAFVATLAAMILLPYVVHLIPPVGGVPLGARLLPIFYAPLVAVILFDWKVGVAASLLAPILNHLLTGSPAVEMVALLTIEVVVFCLVAAVLYRRWPQSIFTGLLAYLGAVVAAALTLLFVPLLPAPPINFLTSSLATASLGMIVLLVINFLLVQIVRQRSV